MVLKTFVLFFCLFYFVSIGNTKKVSYAFTWRQDPCSSIWDRPPHTSLVPPSEIQFENSRYTGSRHHVIPFQILRNFFHTALLQTTLESRATQYLSAYISTIVEEFISNGVSIQHQNPFPVDVDEVVILINTSEEMFAALTWLPGNIFIGPPVDLRYRDNPLNQRGGDPGNAFEEYANRIIRDDTHFTALQNLNRDMQRYVNNPLDVNLFLQIMQNLDIVNRRTTPFPFNAQDWKIVNGKFFIRDRHREKRSQSRKSHRLIAPNTESSTDDDPFDYYVGFCRAVKQELMASHFSSINKKTIKAMDRMTFDCPKNTHIIVKRAIKEGMRNGTEEIKELCDNKRSCLFSKRDTDGLGVDVDYYCANILTSIRKRRELQRLNRRSSSEFELNCPLNYAIRIRKAMSHSAVKETDITPIFREKCDGVNPCKNKLDNWGLQPITVEFSCIPNSSMFV